MKKLVLTLALSVLVSACGISGLQPPTISSISGGNAATQYGDANTGTYGVSAYSLYDVTLSWDVTQTGAQGVEIIVSTDYYCENVILSKQIPASCSSSANCLPLQNYGSWNGNLAHVFYGQNLSVLTTGGYYICIAAITLDSVSSPSLPAYLYLYSNQSGIAY